MLSAKIQKIVIIGAGRLANCLGLAFLKQGLNIVQIYNRTPARGRKLAGRIGADFTGDIYEISPDADCYILAVSDSAIEEMALKLRLKEKLVAHTSGTMEMNVLAQISKNFGVFYPVQTFSPNSRVDFRKVPVCVEGNSAVSEQELGELANKLSGSVYFLSSEKRRILHLGAVFTSNFTNFIHAPTEEFLLAHEIPFDLLQPLILQTARNVKHGKLMQFQTGPAVRGDIKVLDKHREMLSSHPDLLEIYNLITQNIIKHNL